MPRPRKDPKDKAVRLNLTLPVKLNQLLAMIVKFGGYSGPSAYVHDVIRRDAKRFHLREAEPPRHD
jgi:hypothetical protein